MRSTFGKNLIVSIWGGSHEPAVGVDIEGIPIGTEIDMDALQAFMNRRAPGNSPFSTKRTEADIPLPVGGLKEKSPGIMVVTEDLISLKILNTDVNSSDYKPLRHIPRPGHADYTARLRYGDEINMAGGGPFSARMTAPLCIAGGIAIQILAHKGIEVCSHIYSVGDIKDVPFDPINIKAPAADFPVLDEARGEKMKEAILEASNASDSIGGIIEAAVVGLPGGIGGAMYDGIESALAPILFGIPAVKGVEFGAGFNAALLKGSENNDTFYYDNHTDEIKTHTNNHGGILGGITTGMPMIIRLAFKPTPSIGREQDSVDLDKKENTKLTITGRHDPCVVVRAVPVVEAAIAVGLMDIILEQTPSE